MKVAFREEGVHWLSQGKSDENKMMRNSLQLWALLGLFWQAQRTVRSQPIYEVCKSLKKKKKEKKKCSIFLMSASGGSWAAAECQRLGRAQPLSFAFLPETVGWRPLRTELGQPTAPLRPQRGQGTRPGHRSAVSQPPALFLSLLCPFSRFPLE